MVGSFLLDWNKGVVAHAYFVHMNRIIIRIRVICRCLLKYLKRLLSGVLLTVNYLHDDNDEPGQEGLDCMLVARLYLCYKCSYDVYKPLWMDYWMRVSRLFNISHRLCTIPLSQLDNMNEAQWCFSQRLSCRDPHVADFLSATVRSWDDSMLPRIVPVPDEMFWDYRYLSWDCRSLDAANVVMPMI